MTSFNPFLSEFFHTPASDKMLTSVNSLTNNGSSFRLISLSLLFHTRTLERTQCNKCETKSCHSHVFCDLLTGFNSHSIRVDNKKGIFQFAPAQLILFLINIPSYAEKDSNKMTIRIIMRTMDGQREGQRITFDWQNNLVQVLNFNNFPACLIPRISISVWGLWEPRNWRFCILTKRPQQINY